MRELDVDDVVYINSLNASFLRETGRRLVVSGVVYDALRRAGADLSLVQTQERLMLGLPPRAEWREDFLRGTGAR